MGWVLTPGLPHLPALALSTLLAVGMLHLGVTTRERGWDQNGAVLAIAAAAFLVAAFALSVGIPMPVFDMKAGRYGLPVLNVVLAIGGIALTVLLVKPTTWLTAGLVWIGRASLAILLTHQGISILLEQAGVHAYPWKLLISTLGPAAAYHLVPALQANLTDARSAASSVPNTAPERFEEG